MSVEGDDRIAAPAAVHRDEVVALVRSEPDLRRVGGNTGGIGAEIGHEANLRNQTTRSKAAIGHKKHKKLKKLKTSNQCHFICFCGICGNSCW